MDFTDQRSHPGAEPAKEVWLNCRRWCLEGTFYFSKGRASTGTISKCWIWAHPATGRYGGMGHFSSLTSACPCLYQHTGHPKMLRQLDPLLQALDVR